MEPSTPSTADLPALVEPNLTQNVVWNRLLGYGEIENLRSGPPPGRFVFACLIGSSLAAIAFAWMVSNGTWDLTQSAFTSNFYDVQARALLAGHWYMPQSVLNIEGFRIGAHSYMYFGPVPAFMRLPILIVTHRFDGRLTGFSMLGADVLALLFTSCILWRVRELVRPPDAPFSWVEAAFTGGALFVAGFGSILLNLAAWPSVYNEAEIWAVTFSLGAIYFLIRFLASGRAVRYLVLTGIFIFLTLFTRATVGLGLMVPLVIIAFTEFVRVVRHRGGRVRYGTVAASAVGIPLALYALMNEAKFHSLFSVPFKSQVAYQAFAWYRNAVSQGGGSLISVKFLHADLLAYLRPDSLHFTSWFPWVTFRAPASTSSAIATMPAVVIVAVVGTIAIFGRSQRSSERTASSPGVSILRLPAIGAACASVSIFVYGILTQRYLADLFPLLVVTGAAGFAVLAGRSSTQVSRRRLLVGVLGTLALFGLWVELSISLVTQSAIDPFATSQTRAHLVALQADVDGTFLGNRSAATETHTKLPTSAGPAGSVAIIGRCSALYESTGSGWEPVELARAAGHFRMRIIGPPNTRNRSWPLVVIGRRGEADFVTLRGLGHDLVAPTYTIQHRGGQLDLPGPAIRMNPDHLYVVDVALDRNLHEVRVLVNDNLVFILTVPIQNGPVEVGRNTLGGSVAPSYPGRVKTLSVSTQTCLGLLNLTRHG